MNNSTLKVNESKKKRLEELQMNAGSFTNLTKKGKEKRVARQTGSQTEKREKRCKENAAQKHPM